MSFLTGDLFLLIARWIHFLAGVTWIGLLYYFNFVQGAFFAEVDANTKNVAISKLVPRALFYFRYGALLTFLAGLYILAAKGHQAGFAIYSTSWGVNISIGALMGTLMFLNVWLIIWPKQKIVIANANNILAGKPADPAAAAAGAKSTLASRTNTLLSGPMLLFMGMASHYPYTPKDNLTVLWVVVLVIIGAVELNGIKGKTGPMTSVRGVIHCSLALAVLLLVIVNVLA